jgi:hypothetical protein
MNAIPKEWEKRQWARQYNRDTARFLETAEIRNAYFNHHMIWHDIFQPAEGRMKAASVSSHRLEKPEPILVLGSGVSLERAGPLLKQWKGAIIASTSQASSAVYWGHPPEYILALDVATKLDEFLWADTWEGRNTTLLTHPCISPKILDYWKAKKLYFRPMEPNNELYFKHLTVAYDFVKTHMFCFACAVAGQMGIAAAMGYDPIILVGCDFAVNRFRKWYFDREEHLETRRGKLRRSKPKWKRDPPYALPAEHYLRISENGVLTDRIQVYYKRAILCVARLDKANILNASPRGILTEFPTLDIEEVIGRQDTGFEDLHWGVQKRNDAYDLYLARNNVYVIPMGDGVRFYECGNWRRDIPVYCIRLNAEIETAQNAEELRSRRIDIEALLKRVEWLHKTNHDNGFSFSGEAVNYEVETAEHGAGEQQEKFKTALKAEIEKVNAFVKEKLPPLETPAPTPAPDGSPPPQTTHVTTEPMAASVKSVIEEGSP